MKQEGVTIKVGVQFVLTLSDVNLSEENDLTGTITFGQENQMANFFGGNSFPSMAGKNVPKFELIENAKEVYNRLRAQ